MSNLFVAAGIFHPESGGPATYLYKLLPELQNRGWEVRVLTYGDDFTDGYSYPLTRISRRTLPLRMLDYARAARPLLDWADLVYVHSIGLPLIGGDAPRILKVVGDSAWERSVRNSWISPSEDIDLFQTKRYPLGVEAQKTLRNQQVRLMDAIIVPSAYLKRLVMGWGVDESKIHVIYNAIDPLPRIESQTAAREMLGLDDAPLLFTAARLVQWKGIDHIIKTLEHLPDVKFLIAGDGPMQSELEALAAPLGDRVRFLGRVSREQMPLYMQAADYFVLYSGYEGLSHVLLESLSVGTPVIASDKGGNPEVVEHGVNGLLVPYVDLEALKAALQEAFSPGKREQLAANSKLNASRFDFATMVEKTTTTLLHYALQ